MKRAIVTPAALPVTALAELKQWLGISTPHDDALLSVLLRASLDMCEAFTGITPIEVDGEEMLPARSGWQFLSTMPVQSITSVADVSPDGSRALLPVQDYETDLSADGRGRIRLLRRSNADRVAVRFTAGLASDWDSLPDMLRHGVIRLAAHQHRERESSGASPNPPAAVAALWRPWRRVRLA